MPNRMKQKGDRFERAVVAAMRVNGFPHVERTRAGWDDDRGDVTGAPGLVVQAKDVAAKSWGPWLQSLQAQVVNARADHGVLVVKRRGDSDAGSALAVMRFDHWLRLARAAGYGSEPIVEFDCV
jgi:hypothetical protein